MMWWSPGDWGWAWGIAMTLGMIVFWGLVAVAIVAVVRSLRRSQGPSSSPEEILAERFATGDIDEAEYRSRSEALGSHRDPG